MAKSCRGGAPPTIACCSEQAILSSPHPIAAVIDHCLLPSNHVAAGKNNDNPHEFPQPAAPLPELNEASVPDEKEKAHCAREIAALEM